MLLGAVLLAGCVSPGYYLHLLQGQRALLGGRVAIPEVLADPARDPELKRRLALVQEARRYASGNLGLPDNGSYTSYVELGRPFVVWNVFATPEFSLEAREWCHLLVGCLAYRGYYDEARARALAEELRAQGYDTWVGGVPAYSTLGWFDDPVVSSMLRWDDDALVGTLFHELAHQELFVAGDTSFNESLATFVEEEGLRRFRAGRGEPPPSAGSWQREEQFSALIVATRERLQETYAAGLPPDQARAEKQRVLAGLRSQYAELRAAWGGYSGYDAWFSTEINNAKLLPYGLYRQWLPAFRALFGQVGAQWPAFFDAARELSALDPVARKARLEHLASGRPG